MKKKSFDGAVALIGLILLAIGLYITKSVTEPQGIMKSLPFVCIGIGCGAFGSGFGNVISKRAIKNSPELQKQMDINQKDERNVAIANRAKAKAYDIMIFVFSALMISFALMGVDMVAVLLLIFAYLVVIGFSVYYRIKFEKEM